MSFFVGATVHLNFVDLLLLMRTSRFEENQQEENPSSKTRFLQRATSSFDALSNIRVDQKSERINQSGKWDFEDAYEYNDDTL